MKAQKIRKVTVLAITALMFAGTSLYAQHGRNFRGQEKGIAQKEHCMMLPDLTEEQQGKIDALRISHLKEMTAYRNQMNELRAKKQTLQTSDNADLKEINAVIDKMTEVHNKMMKESAKHQQEVRSLLTDEQKVFFDSRSGRGRGHGHGNGAGYGHNNGHGRGYGQGLNPDCPYKADNN